MMFIRLPLCTGIIEKARAGVMADEIAFGDRHRCLHEKTPDTRGARRGLSSAMSAAIRHGLFCHLTSVFSRHICEEMGFRMGALQRPRMGKVAPGLPEAAPVASAPDDTLCLPKGFCAAG
jgi:hypothetical protein